VFAGTPEPALPALDVLLDSPHEVVAVVTRPDAPTGRGRKLEPSPVARHAAERGIEVLTPRTPRDLEFLARLRELRPDCCPVVAYGALLPVQALEIPRFGWVNLHFSLLPAWRGAAPVQHAIWRGDEITGASVFVIEESLDSGPMYGQLTEPIAPTDTAGDLLDRLARSGAQLLRTCLDGIAAGGLTPVPQSVDGISLAPKITAADARVIWENPAHAVDRQIRAVTPAPGAWSLFREQRVKLGPVLSAKNIERIESGRLLATHDAVLVGTATAPVQLNQVQPAGKRPMPAMDWLRGLHPPLAANDRAAKDTDGEYLT
jgi:methionyl-tRNA formyltransferase